MAKKKGKGGYGSEEYDPATGKYVKDDAGSIYHAGARQSVEEMLNDLKSGFYDEPDNNILPSEIFKNDVDTDLEEDEDLWQQKSDLVSYLQHALDDVNTQEDMMNTNFSGLTVDEFLNWNKQCCANLNSSDYREFDHTYKGHGHLAFEFNKALRIGFDKFYQLYPQFIDSPYLSKSAIEDRAEKFERCTNAFAFPRDTKVYRYVDSAPLLSNFKDTGIFDGLSIGQNEFNINIIQGNVDVDDLANRLSNLVGMKMPPDKAFMSFSAVPGYSHMERVLTNGGSVQNTGQDRFIKMEFNCPKGTKAFISDYVGESEGLFNRDTGFFLQKVETRTISSGYGKPVKIIVMQMGVER